MTSEVVQLKTDEDFIGLESEWNILLQQSPVNDAFLTWEWVHTWWKHYGHSYQLCLLIAREDGKLVGIAPLMLETQDVVGFKIRVLRNIGIPPPDVGGIIILNGRLDIQEKIALWLVENQGIWDVLLIGEIPPGGMNFDALIDKFSKRIFTAQVDKTRHFFVSIDGDWQRYCQGLSGNLRKNLERKIRRLQERQGYHYYHKLGLDATLQDMETVFRINQKARHVYLYQDQAEQEFHKELAGLMAAQGWLDIYFLYTEDVPAAFFYGFQYNHTFEYWRSGFDGAYFQFSVGKILLYLLIRDCFEHGIKSLNFLQGDEDHKLDWHVETQLFSHIKIVRNSPIPLAVHVYYPRFKRYLRDILIRYKILRPLLKWIERLAESKQNRSGLKKSH